MGIHWHHVLGEHGAGHCGLLFPGAVLIMIPYAVMAMTELHFYSTYQPFKFAAKTYQMHALTLYVVYSENAEVKPLLLRSSHITH